ncbi:MarC family protein [Psychromonas antarctica]|uniref:MarC family protein n=1 Tax=Psychromonas antarctica TaxID=67573 RepID=UPI001EE79CB9|nr:MarC family protein [Psychromonas antarctica]MCG6201697.1 MarC family protein [Psychromonas antarctica]
MEAFFTLYLKIFFMMTPFFVLSLFLTQSKNLTKAHKKSVIIKMAIAVTVSSLVFLLFGKYIFSLFGITLDAFKIGAGTVLFLSALDMIRSDGETPITDPTQNTDVTIKDFAVVPLAIPSAVGPGMIGILMVIGAEMSGPLNILLVVLSLLTAVISLVGVLFLANRIQLLLGRQGLEILPKITGLFVSAIGAQIVFSGIQGFLL